jgi:hypothetical protein
LPARLGGEILPVRKALGGGCTGESVKETDVDENRLSEGVFDVAAEWQAVGGAVSNEGANAGGGEKLERAFGLVLLDALTDVRVNELAAERARDGVKDVVDDGAIHATAYFAKSAR